MILAAGLGTRLAPFTDRHPKALAKVGDQTVLEWNIRYLQSFGIRDVIINVHHFAEQIENAIADARGWGSNITISDERDAVLDTGGGVVKAAPFFAGEASFLVMNVDILTNFDLRKLIEFHQAHAPMATLAVMHRTSSRYLLFNKESELVGWENQKTKELKGSLGEAFAFSGIQIQTPQFLQTIQRIDKFSLIDAYLDAAFASQKILGFDHTGDVFTDIGKPETLAAAASLFPY